MEENKMKKHVNVVAILQIVFGSFTVLIGLALAFAFGFVNQFVDDPTALKVLTIISTPLVVMFALVGLAMIIGAIGLLNYKSWGKVVTLIMGALGLLNIPIGTLKGVYIIWVLVQPETNALFDKGGKGASVTQ